MFYHHRGATRPLVFISLPSGTFTLASGENTRCPPPVRFRHPLRAMYRMTASSTHGALYSSGRRSDFRLVLPVPSRHDHVPRLRGHHRVDKSSGDCENPSRKPSRPLAGDLRHPRRDPRVARLHVPIPPSRSTNAWCPGPPAGRSTADRNIGRRRIFPLACARRNPTPRRAPARALRRAVPPARRTRPPHPPSASEKPRVTARPVAPRRDLPGAGARAARRTARAPDDPRSSRCRCRGASRVGGICIVPVGDRR